MPPLTDADHAERRHYLGGTDMAALAGVSRWGTPLTVFAEKRPDIIPPAERTTSAMMAMGHLIEPVVAQIAEESLGVRLDVPRLHRSPWVDGHKTRAIQCRYHPWEGANLDRLLMAREAGAAPSIFEEGWPIVECKWGESRRRWGDMTAERDVHPAAHPPARPPVVPEDYFVQVQHYLHVTGRAYAIVVVLLGYAEARWYRIDPDPGLIDALVARGEQFWTDHVVPGSPPPPDGSPAAESRIRARFPADDGLVRPATPGERELLERYRGEIEARDAAAAEAERIKQLLMTSIGTATKVEAPGVSVSWKQNRDSVKTKWQKVAQELGIALVGAGVDPDAATAIVDRHTTTEPGARPFVVTFSDDEEDSDAPRE